MNRSIFNNSHFNFFPIITNFHLHLRNLLKLLPSLKMAKGKINCIQPMKKRLQS